MPRFRKKPVEIDAEQFAGNPITGICPYTYDDSISFPHVHTIHNNQYVLVEIGDWIIPEPDGKHFYPCKPDIFNASYDAIEC